MNIRGASALSFGVLLTLAGCGSSKAITTAAAPATAPASSAAATTPATIAAATATTPPVAGPASPPVALPAIYQFKTTKVGGGDVDGAEFAGKPTAFWFWAPT